MCRRWDCSVIKFRRVFPGKTIFETSESDSFDLWSPRKSGSAMIQLGFSLTEGNVFVTCGSAARFCFFFLRSPIFVTEFNVIFKLPRAETPSLGWAWKMFSACDWWIIDKRDGEIFRTYKAISSAKATALHYSKKLFHFRDEKLPAWY